MYCFTCYSCQEEILLLKWLSCHSSCCSCGAAGSCTWKPGFVFQGHCLYLLQLWSYHSGRPIPISVNDTNVIIVLNAERMIYSSVVYFSTGLLHLHLLRQSPYTQKATDKKALSRSPLQQTRRRGTDHPPNRIHPHRHTPNFLALLWTCAWMIFRGRLQSPWNQTSSLEKNGVNWHFADEFLRFGSG